MSCSRCGPAVSVTFGYNTNQNYQRPDVSFAPGLIGAGTNNARLAGLLRSLSAYYAKEPALLFLVRVAQGLVHMGKGLMTLAPQSGQTGLTSGAQAMHTLR